MTTEAGKLTRQRKRARQRVEEARTPRAEKKAREAAYEDTLDIAHLGSPAALAQYLPYGHLVPYERRPHIDLINDLAVDCTFGRLPEGDGKSLIINIMPQSGKSTTICQWWPVWLNELVAWGVLVPGRTGLATYEGTLAQAWGRWTREAISKNYELLECRVDASSSSMSEWETTTGGGMLARGIGGAFTGRPARRLVVDDPNKSETIQSKEARDTAWEWWLGTGTQRLHPTAPRMVVQARLHEDDFTGRLLSPDHEGDPGEWMHVCIPAIAEAPDEKEGIKPDPLGRAPGEPLYRPDWDYDKDKMVHFIKTKMKEVGPYRAQGTYQQRPSDPKGKLFKKHMFRYWQAKGDPRTRDGVYLIHKDGVEKPKRVLMSACMRFAYVDLAASIADAADYTCAGIFDITPYWDLLLVEAYHDHMEGPEQIGLLQEVWRTWRTQFVGVEAVAYQLTAVQHLRRKGVPVKPVPEEGKKIEDKFTRALTAQAMLADNRVYFPLPARAEWVPEMEGELTAFPTGAHDDYVDILAYAAIAMDEFARNAGWSKG